MAAANRTDNINWFVSTDPNIIRGRINAYNNDWFFVPYGKAVDCMITSQDDDNAIVSADVSNGVKVTLGAVDDAGSDIGGTRFDMIFEVILSDQ